jgi:hypothetical protein
MNDSDERRGDPGDLPDGSASETSHEDTASGGVQPDDSDQDADDSRARDLTVDPDDVDPLEDTGPDGLPIDNPSG